MENTQNIERSPSSITVAAASSAATLITLKATNQIDWNWSLSLTPIWVPISFIFIYGILNGVVRGYREVNNKI